MTKRPHHPSPGYHWNARLVARSGPPQSASYTRRMLEVGIQSDRNHLRRCGANRLASACPTQLGNVVTGLGLARKLLHVDVGHAHAFAVMGFLFVIVSSIRSRQQAEVLGSGYSLSQLRPNKSGCWWVKCLAVPLLGQ